MVQEIGIELQTTIARPSRECHEINFRDDGIYFRLTKDAKEHLLSGRLAEDRERAPTGAGLRALTRSLGIRQWDADTSEGWRRMILRRAEEERVAAAAEMQFARANMEQVCETRPANSTFTIISFTSLPCCPTACRPS
ncbi:MAG: hypothetical protein AAF236_16255, partial [Verrucomicrobiota bacterium]